MTVLPKGAENRKNEENRLKIDNILLFLPFAQKIMFVFVIFSSHNQDSFHVSSSQTEIYRSLSFVIATPFYYTNIKLCLPQNSFYIIQIFSKIDSLLSLIGRQSFFNHMIQKCFQIIVVTVQVIENAGGIQMFQRYLRHYFCNFLQCSSATRESNKSFAQLNHFLFTLCHIFGHN